MKFTGMCVLYSIPATSSEPNLKRGSVILASNLITPKRGDFITYKFNDPEFGESNWIHRLCGMENDTIQIIDGTLFVNGENFDKQYNLQHAYVLNKQKFKSLHNPAIEHFEMKDREGNTTYLTFVEDIKAKANWLAKNRYLDLKTKPDPKIKETYQQDWNKDHFGPLVIPQGKVFVLGDNRDNSMDSRFSGLIDASAINGVYWRALVTLDTPK